MFRCDTKSLAQVMAANLGHESLAVEPARHGGPQSNDFRRVIGSCQALGQQAQFISAQLPVTRHLERMLNHFGLLVRRQSVHLCNYFGRCHQFKFSERWSIFKHCNERAEACREAPSIVKGSGMNNGTFMHLFIPAPWAVPSSEKS